MPRRSIIDALSTETRSVIDRELIAAGFGGYTDLAAQLSDRLGVTASKSTLHRYGQRLERRLAAIRASAEAARAIAEAAPDDTDQRSAAVISLVQSDLFEALLDLQEAETQDDPGARVKLLSQAAHAIAEASRASIGQKRWAEGVRAKLQVKVDAYASRSGLSGQQAEDLRRELLGVVA